jgi:hypothetical protein
MKTSYLFSKTVAEEVPLVQWENYSWPKGGKTLDHPDIK